MLKQPLRLDKAALLVIDMQDRILSGTERLIETLDRAQLALCGFQELSLPVIATEQNPDKLGPTNSTIRHYLEKPPLTKMAFSAYREEETRHAIDNSGRSQWILMGVETHVCLMQTARDLIQAGHEVVVLNDATSSRSIFDYSTAIAEMRDMGARIASTEIVLFELMATAADPHFKTICQWVKGCSSSNCCH